jgi:hypothetical protein
MQERKQTNKKPEKRTKKEPKLKVRDLRASKDAKAGASTDDDYKPIKGQWVP